MEFETQEERIQAKSFSIISHWDFLDSRFVLETEEFEESQIPMIPIPMSMHGEMTIDQINDFVKKQKQFGILPLYNYDDHTIFCFSRSLAEELLKKEHSLLLDKKKVQWLAGAEKKQNIDDVLKRVDDELIEKWDFLNPEFISDNEGKSKCKTPTVPIPMSMDGEMTMNQIEDFISENETIPMSPIFSGDDKVIYCFSRSLANMLLNNGHTLMMEKIKIQFVENN